MGNRQSPIYGSFSHVSNMVISIYRSFSHEHVWLPEGFVDSPLDTLKPLEMAMLQFFLPMMKLFIAMSFLQRHNALVSLWCQINPPTCFLQFPDWPPFLVSNLRFIFPYSNSQKDRTYVSYQDSGKFNPFVFSFLVCGYYHWDSYGSSVITNNATYHWVFTFKYLQISG